MDESGILTKITEFIIKGCSDCPLKATHCPSCVVTGVTNLLLEESRKPPVYEDAFVDIESLIIKRDLDLIEEKNLALLKAFILKMNAYTDEEFVDVLRGDRQIKVKLCHSACQCGGVHNIPCQWLDNDMECNGRYCPHLVCNGATHD